MFPPSSSCVKGVHDGEVDKAGTWPSLGPSWSSVTDLLITVLRCSAVWLCASPSGQLYQVTIIVQSTDF